MFQFCIDGVQSCVVASLVHLSCVNLSMHTPDNTSMGVVCDLRPDADFMKMKTLMRRVVIVP